MVFPPHPHGRLRTPGQHFLSGKPDHSLIDFLIPLSYLYLLECCHVTATAVILQYNCLIIHLGGTARQAAAGHAGGQLEHCLAYWDCLVMEYVHWPPVSCHGIVHVVHGVHQLGQLVRVVQG